MAKKIIDAMWDDSPIDVSTEVNFIWSIANKLRGTYQSDKYKDVIIPMVIIRRFECALAPTKAKVLEQFKANPQYPAKAMYRISGYKFYNTSDYDLAELVNDSDHLAANFKSYIQGFSANIQDIIKSLDFDKQIDKMDKNNRLLSVVKAFSELDLNPVTIDNVRMGYIFEELIRKFSENAEAGDHYTGRDIIKLMVNILLAEGCDDIFDDGKVITVLDQACGTGGMLSTSYNFIKRYNPIVTVQKDFDILKLVCAGDFVSAHIVAAPPFNVNAKSSKDFDVPTERVKRVIALFQKEKHPDKLFYAIMKERFGKTLGEQGVHILDPFTGTGTFIVRLLRSGLIDPSQLLYKYTNELHANELVLLAYYIAAINIEETFHEVMQASDTNS